MRSDYPRDLIGYGASPPHPHWPEDARIALSFVLNYEEGGERCTLHGDVESEAFLSEMPDAQALAGVRNLSMESCYGYGSRAGVWRLLRLFAERQIPLTVFAVAMAVERHPEVIRAMVDAGHEICSHGYRWIDYQYLDEAEEREHLHQAIAIIRQVTGQRPLGWYTGRNGPNTRKLVLEEGGFCYDSDAYDDDLPYWIDNGGKGHLVIPYTLDSNDMRFATAQGFNSGEQFYQYLKDSFDTLYAEGATSPKMLSIGLHCRLAGRPGRIAALARFIDYVCSHDRVWCTRRIDIARHWQQQHPYIPVNGGGQPFLHCRPSQMSRAAFVSHFGAIYEHSPWIAEQAWDAGLTPAHDQIETLHQRLATILERSNPQAQLALINAHPDLAGSAALAGELSQASNAEQADAGIQHCSAAELARFSQLNQAYNARFGFPFIKAVKGSNREQILAAFEERLQHSAAQEFQHALAEINKIALLRLQML